MRNAQIEAKALEIADRTREGKSVEDAAVELKADWPTDIRKAARRLAGHANAAHGQEILWLIGIDESSRTITGATKVELANWIPQVESQFDGIAPNLAKDVIVHIESGETIVALAFHTHQPPYVVKHPEHPDLLEVPWRQGTRVRSARRTELLRMLLPVISAPQFEVLLAEADVGDKNKGCLNLTLELYNTTWPDNWIIIPFHRCSASLTIAGETSQIDFDELEIIPQSDTITKSKNELMIGGPGGVRFKLHTHVDLDKIATDQPVITLSLLPVGVAFPVIVQQNLELSSAREEGRQGY